ncbi:Membrane protein involved in the export of O-antigen and teichoic acid [Methylobacterium sp. 174MFSha1.1]|uniref:lipopolysaccharide biosynthesis protein n=1 Tax=Methylobacterium sp. 174MFSha1.1 TaxID=1502749 RepID=UPI0008E56E98|nr:oligosaccharide flippase family protein [Methylobacterium sp. 174MFSha1.1]SFV16188.1 Membrane protein involved in the export of O-antigen and teichoic acid [Methylobacterium sp. 174MFSha1.1]
MMKMFALSKVGSLAFLGLIEIIVPFMRMIILTRLLGPYEFGYAAALTATYGAIEQITDTSLYRFVLSTPRDRYQEALATAHGIAIVRGAVAATLFVVLSYPISCTLVNCSDWYDFGFLAGLPIIKSFEHLEIRVYERDYRYKPQLISTIVSHIFGLAALICVGIITNTHYALLAYLFLQAISNVGLTHLLSTSIYDATLRGPMIEQALRYSLPLAANGFGLAILTQGDRLLVGAMLGVQMLGVYAVVILASYVPTVGLLRFIGPLQLAGLINSCDKSTLYEARLILYTRIIPIIASIWALGWLVLSKEIVPEIFGSRFMISEQAVMLVGIMIFLRICRTEPVTSLLLQNGSTKILAATNQIPITGLALGALLMWVNPVFESALLGITIGEFFTMVFSIIITKEKLGRVWINSIKGILLFSVFPLGVGVLFNLIEPFGLFPGRIAVGFVVITVIIIIGWIVLAGPIRLSYLTQVSHKE